MAEQQPGCRRCCSCPHGNLVILPGVLSVLSWLFSLSALTTCYFVLLEIKREDLTNDYSVNGGFGFTGYGEWDVDGTQDDNPFDDEWENDDRCKSYPGAHKDSLFDGAWKAGYAFAVLSAISGGVAMVLTLATCCAAFSPIMMFRTMVLYFLAAFFQGLSLIALSSDICNNFAGEEASSYGFDVSCHFGLGSGMSVISTILWFVCGVVTKFIPSYRNDPVVRATAVELPTTINTVSSEPIPYTGAAGFTSTTTITETIQPDGSKVTKKTTTMADGSQIVETTTEQPA